MGKDIVHQKLLVGQRVRKSLEQLFTSVAWVGEDIFHQQQLSTKSKLYKALLLWKFLPLLLWLDSTSLYIIVIVCCPWKRLNTKYWLDQYVSMISFSVAESQVHNFLPHHGGCLLKLSWGLLLSSIEKDCSKTCNSGCQNGKHKKPSLYSPQQTVDDDDDVDFPVINKTRRGNYLILWHNFKSSCNFRVELGG